MMHSAILKSVIDLCVDGGWMLTFVSGYKVLYVLRNVLVEMQFAVVERLDDGALI